ncbi:MAG: dephospho-CoA kinase [Hyphomonas sp.]
MIFLGLTGSIGMGKSATAEMFRKEGVPVYDADAAVHELYEKGGAAVIPLSAAFPGVEEDGAINRASLRARVLDDADAMKTLESIVHPLVGQTQLDFRQSVINSGAPLAILDIPLLFETGGHTRCDYVLVVTASPEVQRARVLAREGVTEEVFENILARQIPDAEKRAKADFIISTAHGFTYAHESVQALVALMRRKSIGDDS